MQYMCLFQEICYYYAKYNYVRKKYLKIKILKKWDDITGRYNYILPKKEYLIKFAEQKK